MSTLWNTPVLHLGQVDIKDEVEHGDMLGIKEMAPFFLFSADLPLSQTKFVILSRGQRNTVTLPQNIMSFSHSLTLLLLCESCEKKNQKTKPKNLSLAILFKIFLYWCKYIFWIFLVKEKLKEKQRRVPCSYKNWPFRYSRKRTWNSVKLREQT